MLPAWAVTPPRFSCDFGTRRIPGRLRLRRAITAHARGCVQLAAHDSLRGVTGVAPWQLVALAAMSYGTHYKDIWTKDPHGGAYHKVSAAASSLESGSASSCAHAPAPHSRATRMKVTTR